MSAWFVQARVEWKLILTVPCNSGGSSEACHASSLLQELFHEGANCISQCSSPRPFVVSDEKNNRWFSDYSLETNAYGPFLLTVFLYYVTLA